MQNEFESMVANIEDITDRITSEKALKESEEKFRSLFENGNDAILVADTYTGNLIDVNKSAERLIGKTKTELIGMHQSLVHPEEEREIVREVFKSASKNIGSENKVFKQYNIINKEGRRIPVEISAKRRLHEFSR